MADDPDRDQRMVVAAESRQREAADGAGEALDGEVLPPAPKRLTPAELDKLGVAASEAHKAVERAGKDFVKHAKTAGVNLINAKAGMPHGDFQQWLKRKTGIRPRTAQGYMRLARELPNLPEAKAQRVAHLSLRDALAELARTSSKAATLPPPVLEQALDGAHSRPLKAAMAQSAGHARHPASTTGLAAADAASTARSLSPEPLAGSGLVQTILEHVRVYKQAHPEVTDADLLAALDEARRQIQAGGVSAGPETGW